MNTLHAAPAALFSPSIGKTCRSVELTGEIVLDGSVKVCNYYGVDVLEPQDNHEGFVSCVQPEGKVVPAPERSRQSPFCVHGCQLDDVAAAVAPRTEQEGFDRFWRDLIACKGPFHGGRRIKRSGGWNRPFRCSDAAAPGSTKTRANSNRVGFALPTPPLTKKHVP